jgi:hypothetical protein
MGVTAFNSVPVWKIIPSLAPTTKKRVIGELLCQLLLVEGFYGMGPVIGILTTAEV